MSATTGTRPLEARLRHKLNEARQVVALMKAQVWLTGLAKVISEAEIAGMEKIIRMFEGEVGS